MKGAPEEPARGAGSLGRHHHKHKQKKDKHKHKDKSKRREAVERNKEVGSDVESGEILGDGAEGPGPEPEVQKTLTQSQQLHGDSCTDVPAVHRAAGVSPAAEDDQHALRRTRTGPPEAGSKPAEVSGQRDEPYAGSRKRERVEVDEGPGSGEAAGNGQDAAYRSRKEARREPEVDDVLDDSGIRAVPQHRADPMERPRDRQQSKRDRDREREYRQDGESREYERQRERERQRDGDRARGDVPAGASRDERKDGRERDGKDRKDRGDRERYREREREKEREERPGSHRERSHRRDGSRDVDLRRASRERSRSRREEGRGRSQSRSPSGRAADRRAGDRRERDKRDGGRDRGWPSNREAHREQQDSEGRDAGKGVDRGRSSPQAKSPEALLTIGDEEEDEEARIAREREERRRRQQAILQRHAQQQVLTDTVVAPTATALAAAVQDSAAATPSRSAHPPNSPGVLGAEPSGPLRHVASASVLTRSAPGTPGQAGAEDGGREAEGDLGGDGDRTPEGERISSSDTSDLNAGGPILDIFGQVVADDADSGPPAQAEVVTAEDAEMERHRQAAAMMLKRPSPEPGASTDLARVVGRGDGGAGVPRGASRRTVGDTGAQVGGADVPAVEPRGNSGVGAGNGAGDDDDDMFAEEDDMFVEQDTGQGVAARAAPAGGAAQLHDSYDDPEGYYNFQIGEVLDNRYEVTEFKGKGVFSTVMRARDHGVGRGAAAAGSSASGPEVAIKVIRANETMYKAAQTEQAILRKLCSSDPDNRKHCIRLLRVFEFRKHMCLVFEPMDMNLRDLTKKYGRNKGLNVTAVAMYTAQLMVALRHLRKNGVLHADIKPDNILVNSRRTKVKLCDFGSAMLAGDNEVTPYLVSRFYRAPEVILGMKYDFAMDMWSVGCVVYELFTGNILFPGRTNNEMIKLMMDIKGPFTKKMLRRCAFADKHFDLDEPSAPFILMEEDTLTKKPVRRMINVQSAKNNFSQLLAPALRSAKQEDKAQIQLLADLLEKMMMLEPEKRIDTDAAMRHPFVRSFLPKKHEHGGHHSRQGQREGSLPL
uniref:non-specific serine/threonine protein kinase n=2 Tax=Volvox carteri f. nagariensis TaxID=3068 RepID=D9CIW8_VOLCA|nr:PRP4f [Volvox carteri f. nagariensis]